jgi:hypothetical protein
MCCADNHLYKTTTSTSVVGRKALCAARSATTSPTRPSTWSPLPARRRTTSARQPDRKTYREALVKPIKAIPAFREPGPRLQLMNGLGLDYALMYPPLAGLVEERMRHQPPKRDR